MANEVGFRIPITPSAPKVLPDELSTRDCTRESLHFVADFGEFPSLSRFNEIHERYPDQLHNGGRCGQTLFSTAIDKRAEEVVQRILEIDPDAAKRGWDTANRPYIGEAARSNDPVFAMKMVKLFLSRGAGVNDSNKYGETALFWSSQDPRKNPLTLYLISQGAKIHKSARDNVLNGRYQEDYKAKVAGQVANLEHCCAALEKATLHFVYAPAPVDETADEPYIIGNDFRAVKEYLQNGLDPNAVDKFGRTALFYSSLDPGKKAMTRLLLQYGGKIYVESRNAVLANRDNYPPDFVQAVEAQHQAIAGQYLEGVPSKKLKPKGWRPSGLTNVVHEPGY